MCIRRKHSIGEKVCQVSPQPLYRFGMCTSDSVYIVFWMNHCACSHGFHFVYCCARQYTYAHCNVRYLNSFGQYQSSTHVWIQVKMKQLHCVFWFLLLNIVILFKITENWKEKRASTKTVPESTSEVVALERALHAANPVVSPSTPPDCMVV